MAYSVTLAKVGTLLFCGSLILISDPNQEIRYDYQGNLDVGVVVLRDKFGYVYMAGTGISDSDGKDFIVAKYNSSLTTEL